MSTTRKQTPCFNRIAMVIDSHQPPSAGTRPPFAARARLRGVEPSAARAPTRGDAAATARLLDGGIQPQPSGPGVGGRGGLVGGRPCVLHGAQPGAGPAAAAGPRAQHPSAHRPRRRRRCYCYLPPTGREPRGGAGLAGPWAAGALGAAVFGPLCPARPAPAAEVGQVENLM
jgi:hypothetical protein